MRSCTGPAINDMTATRRLRASRDFKRTAPSVMSAATTIDPADGSAVKAAVSEYYGKDLTTTGDLKTSACLTSGEVSLGARACIFPARMTRRIQQ